MSDTYRGPGWWLAADGKWYPPESYSSFGTPTQRPQTRDPSVPPPPTEPPEGNTRRRPVSALLLLIGGGAGCVTGLVLFFVVGLAWLLGTVSYDTPVHVDIDCGSGVYYVFEQTGSQVTGPGFSFTHDQAPNLIPDQVQVIGPLQTPLRTWLADGSETITKGSQIYTNAVGFDVTVPGRYSVSIVSTSPVAVLIAPSLGGQFARAAPWLILVAIGFCVAVVGLVLLIVDRSRRRKAATAVGPPQWHPA